MSGGFICSKLLTALQAFKDEYLLDFINVETDDERVVEKGIVQNIKEFILKAGKGFAFIGNQHRLLVDDEEFFVDIVFYNRQLKCLVAVELKKGKFKPIYAGQLNFYRTGDPAERIKRPGAPA